jgi:hypothetical protein
MEKTIGIPIINVIYSSVGVFTYSIVGSDLDAGRNGATSFGGRNAATPVRGLVSTTSE